MDHNRYLFDGMVLFCTIVEQQSLSAAAKLLGHTPSYVSKELARLEMRLTTRLLNRTTRKISLTETGQIYYDNARRFMLDARLVEAHVLSLGDRPFGELKISVPTVFAQGCFNGWLPEFLQQYPDVQLNIDVSDTKVDMIASGFDMVVRIGTLSHSDMIARELFRTGLFTIAAPHYLSAHGTPKRPHDLSQHRLIDFSGRTAVHSWTYKGEDNSSVTVNVDPRIRCNDAEMELALVLAGQGITRLPELTCGSAVDQGRVVRILRDYEPTAASVHLIYPNRAHLPPKTRAMADFLVRKSKAQNWGHA